MYVHIQIINQWDQLQWKHKSKTYTLILKYVIIDCNMFKHCCIWKTLTRNQFKSTQIHANIIKFIILFLTTTHIDICGVHYMYKFNTQHIPKHDVSQHPFIINCCQNHSKRLFHSKPNGTNKHTYKCLIVHQFVWNEIIMLSLLWAKQIKGWLKGCWCSKS